MDIHYFTPRDYPGMVNRSNDGSIEPFWIDFLFFNGDTTGMKQLGIKAEFPTERHAMFRFPLCLLAELVTNYPSIVFRPPIVRSSITPLSPVVPDERWIITDSLGDTMNR